MPIKETLKENEASDLSYLLNEAGTLSMTIKNRRYFENGVNFTFYPLIRVQGKTQNLESYAEEYGGSVYTDRQNDKQIWTWNLTMIRNYLPHIIEHLSEKQKPKAQIILESLKFMHGYGHYQDEEPLRKLYEEIKQMQEPRPRHINPWNSDRTDFY
jgi:hypothetical protein